MKRVDGSSKMNKMKGKGIGAATVLVSLIAFLIVISLLESNSRASTILDLQPSFNNYAPLSSIEGTTNHLQQGKESNVVPISSEEKHKPENISSETDGVINLPIRMTEDLGSNEKTTDNDEKPTLPTVSSEDTSPKEKLVVKETNELAIPAEEKDDSNNSNQDDGGEMMLPTRLPEQWNQDKTTESSKMELNAGEKSETTEWSQDEATESSNTELNAEEKSEITESQSVNSENQENIKPDDDGEMMLPTRLTEQWNQDKTTESLKMELNAGEKSETTEWSQDEAIESSNTELNTEEKSEITESQSANSENQEDIKSEEIPSNQNQKNKLECDFTHPRADTCTMEGDVRVLGTYSTVFLVSPTAQDTTESKIRPYARKWEKPTMQMIREVNVKQALPDQAPPCTVHHDVPVVVFSTGGFVGNVFHDYTDILIPLFLAANQYEGKVQFAVTDMSWWWIFKYLPIIKTLSPYPILNLDQDKNVHCFPSAQIGVKSHKPMGVDPTQSPNGYTMQDFRAFIRKSFSLKRSHTRVIDLKSGKRPRLLILLRRGTRAIVNEKQLIAMAKKIGFRVVAADPDKTREFPKFAHVVNSCDVMLGVHGAGLANMLYLPTNATVIQILPWGDLGFVGRHDYGLPLPDMGLRYVEHEIKEDESTLIYKYPRDHAVFTNPQAIHDQGWDTMYRIFLNEQNIMLNVDRFKGVLIDVFKSYVR